MFLIHSSESSPRLKYVLNFLFSELLQTSFTLTSNKEEFQNSNLPKISYGSEKIGNEFFIKRHHLLFENKCRKQELDFTSWDGLAIFYKTEKGDLPFDIFSACFFLISRYEEYLPYKGDRHGRYKAEDSAAYKGGFLNRPIIDLWVERWKALLIKRYPNLCFPLRQYSFTPTIDIDNAYAYKYKGVARIGSSLVSKLLKLQFKKFTNRLKVHCGLEIDPYDTYEKQERIHTRFNIKPLYFILLGDYGQYDRNLPHTNAQMIKLIQRLGDNGNIGIHPSYASNKNAKQLKIEKERLENIVGSSIQKSRQHYVKMKLPDTYSRLIQEGIQEDYSMGYPSEAGFRAGTCSSFYFYDLSQEAETTLRIFPFIAMDSTMKYYQRFREKEVVSYLRPMVNDIKKVGGNFNFIFHNESIGGKREWKSWGDTYEKVIKLALEDLCE